MLKYTGWFKSFSTMENLLMGKAIIIITHDYGGFPSEIHYFKNFDSISFDT